MKDISPERIRVRCFQKFFLLSAIAIIVIPATVHAQQPPSLEWELVNPFRFIHDQQTIDELRAIYNDLKVKSAATLERELQNRADREVEKVREEARHNPENNCDHPKSDAEKRRCFAPYLGWFAKLAQDNHAKTCWDSDGYKFRKNGPCADYIYPQSHRVRVWVSNPEMPGDSSPQWLLEPSTTFTPCDIKYHGRFCIEFAIPYSADNPLKIKVSAQFPSVTLTLNPDIQVKDKLIVGLGDSYAAGEGNPDIPAEFAEGRDERDRLANLIFNHQLHAIHSPQSDEKTRARWLDQRCHRSMYSYQFKTALELALSNPQEAITYVSFSCTGATTLQIVEEKQKSNEGGGKLRPQLEDLSKLLQNGTSATRPIDYLLLSTGGNDILFSKLVAFVVLPEKVIKFLKHYDVTEQSIIDHNAQNTFKGTLLTDNDCGNYRQLQQALLGGTRCPQRAEIHNIHIRDCAPDTPCPRILLTPYPNVFEKETGESCDGNREEFDRPFMRDPNRGHRINVVRENVFGQLARVQQDDITTRDLGWTVITSNVTAFAGHGFCALNKDSRSKTAEEFRMPRLVDHKWDSFNPWEYRAYETRQRWMRLPVDAKLSTNQMHIILKRIKFDFALEDDRSNIMHPTAEGLAMTADLNAAEIRKLEGNHNPQ